MIARRDAAGVLAVMVMALGTVAAQTADSAPTVRHILALDYARVRAFHRSYDMFVITGDSTVPIGRRDLTFSESVIADSSNGWMLVESRTGVVSSTDSILLGADLRPIRWHSVIGAATLDLAFTADSTNGVIRVGKASSHLALAVPPDVIVSSSVIEMLAALLPLTSTWSDSVNSLSVNAAGAKVEPSELSVSREDSALVSAGLAPRPCWVLTLKAGLSEARFWLDRKTVDVVRAQMTLPAHVGALLEYRIHPGLAPAAP